MKPIGTRGGSPHRVEICTSVRNMAEFDAEMQALAAMPLLNDTLPAVSEAARSLQRALVQRGTHRGPKVVDLVICFECLQVKVVDPAQPDTGFLVSESPQKTFDQILKEAGVPLGRRRK